jgi:hypothetical protein
MEEISPHHNYGFGSVSLANLQLDGLPEKIELEGNVLLRKSEFHITLVSAKKLAPIIDATKAKAIEKEIVQEFLQYIQREPLTRYSLLNTYRFVQRGERKTLVRMVEVPHLVDFFHRLEERYHTTLPLQPTHITLYTLPPDVIGIGLLSEEELNRDSRFISAPAFTDQSL